MKPSFTISLSVMISLSLLISNCSTLTDHAVALGASRAFDNSPLIRGMNLGNALEAPSIGEWGVTIQPEYFKVLQEAAFKGVRIPVRFSAHAGLTWPYSIEPDFLKLVDDSVNQGLQAGLIVTLDLHNYEAIMVDPAGQRERFHYLWKQLSEHYQNAPPNLYFELLNEPNQHLDANTWNSILKDVVGLIRLTNPQRKLLVGGVNFNNIESLDQLQIPNDKNLIATFHFYTPFEFTHQGASWVVGSNNWKGKSWEGTPEEQQAINEPLNRAAAWSARNKISLVMGEFGVIATADAASRQKWTDFVARAAERLNISWFYWEYCSEFGVYNCKLDTWNADLLQALIPK